MSSKLDVGLMPDRNWIMWWLTAAQHSLLAMGQHIRIRRSQFHDPTQNMRVPAHREQRACMESTQLSSRRSYMWVSPCLGSESWGGIWCFSLIPLSCLQTIPDAGPPIFCQRRCLLWYLILCPQWSHTVSPELHPGFIQLIVSVSAAAVWYCSLQAWTSRLRDSYSGPRSLDRPSDTQQRPMRGLCPVRLIQWVHNIQVFDSNVDKVRFNT